MIVVNSLAYFVKIINMKSVLIYNIYIYIVENLSSRRFKFFWSNGGGEFCNLIINSLFAIRGILH